MNRPKKQNKLAVLLFALFFQAAFVLPAVASDNIVAASAKADRVNVFIGDKITYTIRVSAPSDIKIEFPQFAENLGGFAVKDFGGRKKKNFFKKEIIWEQWYALDTYTTGKYQIPATVIKYKTPGGKEESLSVPAVAIEVKSILMLDGKEPTDIKDIKPPLEFARKWWLWILISSLTIFIIAGVLVYFLLKTAKAQKILAAPKAHEIAYRALDSLKESDLLKNGLVSEYFFRLSLIVRQYLENRFYLRAPEMTTEEFLQAMKESDKLSSQIKSLLKDFLQQADMVKFAKYGPTAAEILGAFNAARRLVDETKGV